MSNRRLIPEATAKRMSVTLDEKSHEALLQFGEGNLSLGIRRAVSLAIAPLAIAAPTQGADARPVAITDEVLYKLWALALDSTEHEFKASAPALLATRDAEASDAQDAVRYRWLRDVSVPPHNFYMSVPEEFKDVKYSKADVDCEIDKAIAAIAPMEKT